MDLGPIKAKLFDTTDGPGWSVERIQRTEVLYKKFLFLCATRGSERAIVPTKDIDEMWHHHILDTRKYAEDCEKFLGKFIHHFPYLGMGGEKEAIELQNAFADTIQLFDEQFGRGSLSFVDGSDVASVCGNSVCRDSATNELLKRPSFDPVPRTAQQSV